MTWQFKCPECGGHNIEEVLSNAVVSTRVDVGFEDGEAYAEVTGEHDPEIHDGHLERFQCENCGWVIKMAGKNVVTDYETLLDWITNRAFVDALSKSDTKLVIPGVGTYQGKGGKDGTNP